MAYMTHTAKKRRLEQASSTLSRPFKSPLRKPIQKNPTDKESHHHSSPLSRRPEKREENHLSDSASKDDSNNNDNERLISRPTSNTTTTTTTAATNNPTPNPKKTNPGKPSLLSSSSSSAQSPLNPKQTHRHLPNKDPTISTLQKQQRILQSRLLTLRSELDTATQALKIESSTKDAELESLIVNWRSVSQDAAEEVFGGARERVARMGGVGVWRRQQFQQQRGRGVGWDDYGGETTLDGHGEDGDGDGDGDGHLGGGGDVDTGELEIRRAEMVDCFEVPFEEGERGKVCCDEEKGQDDETFTMDMMLNTLNIDLKVIGFDKANQRWIKD